MDSAQTGPSWYLSLKEKFGDDLVMGFRDFDFEVFEIKPNSLLRVIEYLKNDPSMQFGFLTTACGLHYPDQPGKELGMMYQLHNLEKNHRIRLKTFVPLNHPVLDSLSHIFSAANWMEREAFDFFGIRFTGHPDLRRILNMEDIDFFPMRKEFPLEDPTREDKNDTFFGR